MTAAYLVAVWGGFIAYEGWWAVHAWRLHRRGSMRRTSNYLLAVHVAFVAYVTVVTAAALWWS